MWRGEDLLPLPDAGLYYAGSAGLQLLRVNGPFLSNTSLALIGLITFFLLGFLKRATSAKTVSWGRGLHALGATSALLVALMPLFRSVVLTLLTVFLLESLQTRGSVRRVMQGFQQKEDRKSTRLNSSHLVISYAVFCLKKKKKT